MHKNTHLLPLSILVLVVVSGFLFLRAGHCAEYGVRYWGLSFQLVGFALVAWNLHTRNPISKYLLAVLEELREMSKGPGPRRSEAAPLSARGDLNMSPMTLLRPAPDSEIARTVELLRQNAEALWRDVGRMNARVTALEHDTSEGRDAHGRIDKELARLKAGQPHLEWIGVIMFPIGVVLATIPTEIAGCICPIGWQPS